MLLGKCCTVGMDLMIDDMECVWCCRMHQRSRGPDCIMNIAERLVGSKAWVSYSSCIHTPLTAFLSRMITLSISPQHLNCMELTVSL